MHTIRPVQDADRDAVLALLGAVYSEYEGCVLVLSEVPELHEPATWALAHQTQFWIAEREGALVGMVAIAPSHAPGLFELKKLYVAKTERGTGLGKKLIALAESHALANGAERIHLWSDTRFLTAHAVYAHLGYDKLPETRDLHDESASIEFHFEKAVP